MPSAELDSKHGAAAPGTPPSPRTRTLFDGPAHGESALGWVLAPWRAYLLVPVVLCAGALLISYAIPNKYRASAQMYPEQPKASGGAGLGSIAGLATQMGVGLASGAQSPQFYVQVLGSRRLLEEVLASRVKAATGDSLSLRDYLEKPRSDASGQLDRALTRLREATDVTVNPRTNIVEIGVTLRDRQVAMRTVTLYMESLSRFNLQSRQTQAGQRRRFAEARLREAQDSLGQVDRAISEFLMRNRQYRESPALSYEYERLQRALMSYQTLYTGIRRDYDTARLDEVNDTPVLTVVDPPQLPLRKASPSRMVAALGGGALGGLAVLFWAALRAFVGRLSREDREQFEVVATIGRRMTRRRA